MKFAPDDHYQEIPPPEKRQALEINDVFTLEQFEKMKKGFRPEVMEQKWAVYFCDGCLYFRRSWTGLMTYALNFEVREDGAHIVSAWVSDDPNHYRRLDDETEKGTVLFLIYLLLLKENYPTPKTEHGGDLRALELWSQFGSDLLKL